MQVSFTFNVNLLELILRSLSEEKSLFFLHVLSKKNNRILIISIHQCTEDINTHIYLDIKSDTFEKGLITSDNWFFASEGEKRTVQWVVLKVNEIFLIGYFIRFISKKISGVCCSVSEQLKTSCSCCWSFVLLDRYSTTRID